MPPDFSETAEYDNRDVVTVQTLSFRVLAHAEIEAYFEDRVVEIAKAALDGWKKERRLCRPLLCLVAFSGKEMRRPPDSLAAPADNKRKVWPAFLDPTTRFQECATAFVKAVQRENHGIREKNLLALLLPVGVDYVDLDPLLVADLDSFSFRRGEAAHKTSNPTHVQSVPDPKEERDLVDRLLAGIAGMDSLLDTLLVDACPTELHQ